MTALSFARTSNILTNKYGIPQINNQTIADEEEDPLDAFMKEIDQ
jgi:hypothetical protein